MQENKSESDNFPKNICQTFKKYHPMMDYEIEETIGSGSFSIVRKCTHKVSRISYAIKIIEKKDFKAINRAHFENEIRILRRVTHRNVVELIDVYETAYAYFIIMELIQGGELYQGLINQGRFLEANVFPLFSQLVDAVRYLHSIGVCHRDLKLENILFENSTNQLKLTDFGLSKMLTLHDHDLMKTRCGTPTYIAPEVIRAEEYSNAIDIWSLGVILYTLLYCNYPFTGDTLAEIFDNTLNGKVLFPENIQVSEEVKDLILKLLCNDPKERLNIDQISSHPWMKRFSCKQEVHCNAV